MNNIDEIMSFVNRTFKESKNVEFKHLLVFAISASLKLAFLYGILWVITRFIDISIK